MLSREISANCLPNPSTRDIQQELMGVHLQLYSVIQPYLSAPSTDLQGEMHELAQKIFLCNSSWTGRVGRRDKEELKLCHEEPKQAKIQMLISKHSWRLLIFSALWSKPSLTRDHCAKEEDILPSPVLAECASPLRIPGTAARWYRVKRRIGGEHVVLSCKGHR